MWFSKLNKIWNSNSKLHRLLCTLIRLQTESVGLDFSFVDVRYDESSFQIKFLSILEISNEMLYGGRLSQLYSGIGEYKQIIKHFFCLIKYLTCWSLINVIFNLFLKWFWVIFRHSFRLFGSDLILRSLYDLEFLFTFLVGILWMNQLLLRFIVMKTHPSRSTLFASSFKITVWRSIYFRPFQETFLIVIWIAFQILGAAVAHGLQIWIRLKRFRVLRMKQNHVNKV